MYISKQHSDAMVPSTPDKSSKLVHHRSVTAIQDTSLRL